MRAWGTSGQAKINWADKHIDDLQVEINEFRDRRPYEILREPDLDTDEGPAYVVRANERIPPCLSAITADAVHNLHVALDHLWQRAVHGAKHVKRDHFPAYESPERAETRFKGKEKGRLKRAVDVLKSANAFRVGNPFWTIRCFDDADKHDTMMLVAVALTGVILRRKSNPNIVLTGRLKYTLPTGSEFLGQTLVLKDGAIIQPLGADPDMDVELHPSFHIAFGDGGPLKGEAVLPTIKGLSQSVRMLSIAFMQAGLLQ